MFNFFNEIFLDNSVKSYLLVFAVILFVILLKRFISRYVAGLLFNLIRRIWKDLDKKSFTGLVVQPLGLFLVIFVCIVSLHKLTFPRLLEVEIYKYTTSQIVHVIATIVLIISFIWLLLRIIDFIAVILQFKADLTPDQSDNQLIVFFKDFFKVIIVFNGILMIFHFAFDFEVRNLLTGLGLVGAALALSLRESLENLIASFIIFFDRPFATGDQIKVQNITGTVEKIGLRSTRLRTDQKTFVTVPNKQMVDTILDNLSLRSQRKAELKLEIGLSTSPELLDNLIYAIRKILERKEIENSSVFLNDINGHSFLIQADYFTAPVIIAEFNTIRQDINMKILRAMEELHIEIAGASADVRIIREKE
jgi:MscS family membrane protein